MRGKLRDPAVILIFAFLALVFLSAFNKVHNEDAWLHLSLGRLIWEHKGFPASEVFTYPYFDMPFFYTSWFFGLVCYLAYEILGVSGVVLLKAGSVCLAFLVMLRDSLRPVRNIPVSVFILLLGALFSINRFVLRPELFVMVFLPLSIYCLNAYYYEKRKYIFWLPLLHLVWVNTHSSIPLMHVVFVSFMAGGALQRFFGWGDTTRFSAPSYGQVGVVCMVYAASVAASFANPLVLGQYTYGLDILSAEWNRQYVSELLPPIGGERALILAVDAVLALSFVVNRRRIGIIHLLLVAPFMAMPFVSVRFELYLALVGGPVLARNISVFIADTRAAGLPRWRPALAASALSVAFSGLIVFTSPGTLDMEERVFGTGFDHSKMPKGAVEYMDDNGVEGRVLNSYHFGQYITWTGHPRRTVYVDGRANLSEELLSKLNSFRSSNAVLDELYDEYGFESILIEYPHVVYDPPVGVGHAEGMGGKRHVSLSHPDWAAVYWDDLSILYLRRDGEYVHLVERDEYRHITPDIGIDRAIDLMLDEDRSPGVEMDLERNVRDTGSSRALALLGIQHNLSGRHGEAIRAFNSAGPIDDPDYEYVAALAAGDSYLCIGDHDRALELYEKSLGFRRNPMVMVDAGRVCFDTGRYGKAAMHLTEAILLDSGMLHAYPLLIESYEKLGKPGKALEIRREYLRRLEDGGP